MATKKLSSQTDYIINEYTTGRTISNIANEFGVTHKVVKRIIVEAGLTPPNSTAIPLDSKKISRLYLKGMSTLALSSKYGVSRSVIDRNIKLVGVTLRTQSKSEKLKWSQMSQKQRRLQVKSAHDAVRGMKRSFDDLCRRAKGKEKKQSHVSEKEIMFCRMLKKRGIDFIQQKAVGIYNCDIASFPIAVEIWGGNFHFFGRHLTRTPKRFRYFFDCGWSILAVTTFGGIEITEDTADYVASYIKQARSNPPSHCEYRVIRGAGQVLASGCSDDDNITIIPSFTRSRNSLGQYTATLD